MHPAPQFRGGGAALLAGPAFGMVFAATPAGPRVAHVPFVPVADGALQFHLARGNALTRHLTGGRALAVINGADFYVSPRWYAAADQVPTWNYAALEIEGPVRRLNDAELEAQVAAVSARGEARVAHGTPWTMDKMSDRARRGLLAAIVGFELIAETQRETVKLSQNKSAAERARVAAGLAAEGQHAAAALLEA